MPTDKKKMQPGAAALRRRNADSADIQLANIMVWAGSLCYGILSLIVSLIGSADSSIGWFKLLAGATAAVITFIIQRLMKDNPLLPLSVLLAYLSVAVAGAVYSSYYPDYFLLLVCIIGTMCVYRNFMAAVISVVAVIAVNAALFILIYPRLGPGGFETFGINSALFIECSVILCVLCYRSSRIRKEAEYDAEMVEALFGATPHSMVMLDAQNRVMFMSEPMARLAGVSGRVSASGYLLADLIADEDLRRLFTDSLETAGCTELEREVCVGSELRSLRITVNRFQGTLTATLIEVFEAGII